jgi:hypothetical protein
MPPLPDVPGVIRLAISGTCDTFPWVNALHFAYTGAAPGNSDIASMLGDLHGFWDTHLTPLQDTLTALLKLEGTDLTSPTSAQNSLDVNVPGTRAGEFLPADACLLINYPITRRYRGGKPRQYLCVGVQGDLLDRSHWTSAFAVATHAAWNAFIDAFVGATYAGTTISSQGCVSYYSKIVNPVPPYRRTVPVYEPFAPDDNSASEELSSQRRRIGRK